MGEEPQDHIGRGGVVGGRHGGDGWGIGEQFPKRIQLMVIALFMVTFLQQRCPESVRGSLMVLRFFWPTI